MALPNLNDLYVLQARVREAEREVHRMQSKLSVAILSKEIDADGFRRLELDAEGLCRAAAALVEHLRQFA